MSGVGDVKVVKIYCVRKGSRWGFVEFRSQGSHLKWLSCKLEIGVLSEGMMREEKSRSGNNGGSRHICVKEEVTG